jgi:hypothetical protein
MISGAGVFSLHDPISMPRNHRHCGASCIRRGIVMKRSRRVVLTMMGSAAVGVASMGFAPYGDCGPGRYAVRTPDGRIVCYATYGGFGHTFHHFHHHGHGHGHGFGHGG